MKCPTMEKGTYRVHFQLKDRASNWGIGFQSHSHNSDPELFLSKRNLGTKMQNRLKEVTGQHLDPFQGEAPTTNTITDGMVSL